MYKTVSGKIFFFSSLLVAFLIPLSSRITVFAIGAMLLLWLFTGEWLNTFRKAFKNSIFILLVSFLLLHLVGLLYSENMHAGWFDIEVKLTMILFPLIFFFSDSLDTKKRKLILKAFCTGTTVAIIACIVNAFFNYNTMHADAFYYGALSVFHHPSYFAMFVCFFAAIVANDLLYKDNKYGTLLKVILVVLLIFLAAFIYMLSSKSGIVIYFMTLFLIPVPALFQKKKRVIALLILMIAGFQVWFSLTQNLRFQVVVSSVKNAEQNVATGESSGVRVLVYETAIDLIKQNYAMGVGTGDIKDVLMCEYQKRNMAGAFEKKLNAHNQFLETWLGQGIAGITLLLLLFIAPFVKSFRQKKWLLVIFILITSANFMFESMLNTQAGVVFFAFFYSYFATESEISVE